MDESDDQARDRAQLADALEEHEQALARAQNILAQYQKLSGTKDTAATIERLLSDLEHFCFNRNESTEHTFQEGEELDVDVLLDNAKDKYFEEIGPILDDRDPQLTALTRSLDERHGKEAAELMLRHAQQAQRGGYSEEQAEAQRRERAEQQELFRQERQRYVDEYHEAKKLARDMQKRHGKGDDLAPDEGPDLSR
jgi:predicted ArsR family transcriptional regulator